MHKAGFVNIIGNPNVGKSTLMNALVGEKLSIITSKAQTTRHRIMGIVNGEDSIIAKVKGDKMVLITDCTRAGGMPDGEYDLGGQPIFLQGIECRLADGTIAGSVLKLNNAVKNVLDHTALPANEVFKMASLNPATAIHCADRIGSLEAGKDADIIIADENINVVRTIKKGRTIYEA